MPRLLAAVGQDTGPQGIEIAHPARIRKAKGQGMSEAVDIDSTATVGRLAGDLFYWSDKARNDWCFAYCSAAIPAQQTPDILTISASEAEE